MNTIRPAGDPALQAAKRAVSKPYTAQLTVERHFKTKVEAERWLQQQDNKFTLEAEVDTISTSIGEPAT